MGKWYYWIDGREGGPVEASLLKRLATDGHLKPSDSVRKERDTQWYLASQVRGLFTASTESKTLEKLPTSQRLPGCEKKEARGTSRSSPSLKQKVSYIPYLVTFSVGAASTLAIIWIMQAWTPRPQPLLPNAPLARTSIESTIRPTSKDIIDQHSVGPVSAQPAEPVIPTESNPPDTAPVKQVEKKPEGNLASKPQQAHATSAKPPNEETGDEAPKEFDIENMRSATADDLVREVRVRNVLLDDLAAAARAGRIKCHVRQTPVANAPYEYHGCLQMIIACKQIKQIQFELARRKTMPIWDVECISRWLLYDDVIVLDAFGRWLPYDDSFADPRGLHFEQDPGLLKRIESLDGKFAPIPVHALAERLAVLAKESSNSSPATGANAIPQELKAVFIKKWSQYRDAVGETPK